MRTVTTNIFSLVLTLALCNHCLGASLKNLQLTPDGSADPPGDRIDLVIQFDPGESEISCLIRGFKISGDRNEIVASLGVASVRDETARDESESAATDKGVLRRVNIVPDPDSMTKQVSIVIPYSQLRLNEGSHKIAYEVVGMIGEEVVFSNPTPLTQVLITGETRREMRVTETKLERGFEERTQQVRVGVRVRGEPPKLVSKETFIRVPVTNVVNETTAVSVDIPGGYKRTKVSMDPIAANSESDLSVSDAQSLANQAWRPASELEPEKNRRIWFATNRVPAMKGATGFTVKLAEEVQYGSCIVSVPVQNHRKGNLEVPSWWSKRDPEKHFVMNKVETFDKAVFTNTISDGDVLLFIHGFYNTFHDAIFRTAQLKHDLDFAGEAVSFSWPSAGDVSKYEEDQESADASVDALVDVIATLASTLKEKDGRRSKIHIIAHSMGNRILTQAMYQINESRSDDAQPSPFGQIILAAPDVGAIMFNNLSPHVVDLGEQVTYYYCKADMALTTSRKLNLYEPVGLLPYFGDGLFTIDANGVGTSFISHGYYASSREVLGDIELMLKYGRPPSERMPPLAMETRVFGHKCWAFMETKDTSELTQ